MAYTINLLLTEADFKKVCYVSDNLSATKGFPQAALDAQLNYLRPILCDDLYEELLNQVVTNTLTPANILLLERVIPALAYYTLWRLLPLHNFKVREQGQVAQTGTTASPVSATDSSYTRVEVLGTAIGFGKILQKFLSENSADYPLWCCKTSCGGEVVGLTDDIFMVI